jgi:LL-diaminopimelate aminotransferase
MVEPSEKLKKIKPYFFSSINKKTSVYMGDKNIINLALGDPDSPTYDRIIQKMHQAIDEEKNHHYPPYYGLTEFKEAVSNWYKKRFKVTLDAEKEVLALIGSKEGIAHLLFAYLNPGDFAIIPSPSYPVYEKATILAGGVPYIIPLIEKNSFLPDLDNIPKDIAKKAKVLFLNYPNNPTGAIADIDFYKKAVNYCHKYDILLVSDLAYSEMTFNNYIAPSVLEIEGAMNVAIEFHSLSKSFNMTGFRIGMAVGNKDAIKNLSTIKSNIDTGVFKAIQIAALEALTNTIIPNDPEITTTNMNYKKRQMIFIEGLGDLGIKINPPLATFYLWIPTPSKISSIEFSEKIFNKCGILVAPGNTYGSYGEGYFRIALTQKDDLIREAITRIKTSGIFNNG